jgi:phosphoglycerate dehydrogenase-like enzyme
MHVLIYSRFAVAELTRALAENPAIFVSTASDKTELETKIGGADALVIPASLYDEKLSRLVEASELKWIHFITSGVDPLLRYPSPTKIIVTNSAAAWAPSVAEHAVALLLAFQRQIHGAQIAKMRHEWKLDELRPRLQTVGGSTIVILGFGMIGRQIARRLKGFDVTIIAVARSTREHPDVTKVLSLDGLDAILPQVDAVVAALPYSPSTVHLINARRLSLLSDRAVIVNVGRGDVIDEAALEVALRAGKIRGAALDVYEREPLPAESGLWSLDNVILTPHLAGMGSKRLFQHLGEICAENAACFLAGGEMPTRVQLQD